MSRPRRVFSAALIVAGSVVLGWAGGTYLTGWIGGARAEREAAQLAALAGSSPTLDEARELRRTVVPGTVLGLLEIDRLDLEAPVLAGLAAQTLMRGAGHVPGTTQPGQQGTVVLAAHRDLHFAALRYAEVGDEISLSTSSGIRRYVVAEVEVVDPTDTEVLRATADQLVLITCYPFRFVGPAPRRLLVHAVPAARSAPFAGPPPPPPPE